MIKSLLLVLLVLTTLVTSAQSPFERLPKPKATSSYFTVGRDRKVTIVQSVADSNIKTVRFSITPIAYSYPSNHILVGAGAQYGSYTYHADTDTWYVDWGIGAYLWYNTVLPTGNTTNQFPVSYGPALSLFNGIVLVGAAYDGHKLGPVLGLNIPLK